MAVGKFKIGDRLEALVNGPVGMAISVGDVIEVESIGPVSYGTAGPSGLHNWVFDDYDAHLFKLVGGPSFEPEVISDNPLYHYRASEETGYEAWGTLAKAVAHHSLWPDVKQQFKDWEVEYTTVTSLPLPHAWRSAKSVIKRAFEYSIPITQPSGTARGKTAVEKDIKAAKETEKEVLTARDKANKLAEQLVKHCRQHGIIVQIDFEDDIHGYMSL